MQFSAKIVYSGILLVVHLLQLAAQQPISPPVSLPVYFSDSPSPEEHPRDISELVQLTGVALVFLDTSLNKDHLLISKPGNPVIWYDKVGISTRVTFIVPDSLQKNSLELLFSNSVCSASFYNGRRKAASGSVRYEYGRYVMRMVGKEEEAPVLLACLEKLNAYLLRLHQYDLKEIPLKPLLNRDSLNVIVGVDYQFNTNFDLLWFDESIRSRLKELSGLAYLDLMDIRQTGDEVIHDTIENNALVMHTARLLPGDRTMMTGSTATIFQVSSRSDYFFLRAGKPYLLKIKYRFKKYHTGNDRLLITHFIIKNMETGDFVEMEVFDFADAGFPILYIDLIRSVVMEDHGAWKIRQIMQVIQDVFRLIKLPNED